MTSNNHEDGASLADQETMILRSVSSVTTSTGTPGSHLKGQVGSASSVTTSTETSGPHLDDQAGSVSSTTTSTETSGSHLDDQVGSVSSVTTSTETSGPHLKGQVGSASSTTTSAETSGSHLDNQADSVSSTTTSTVSNEKRVDSAITEERADFSKHSPIMVKYIPVKSISSKTGHSRLVLLSILGVIVILGGGIFLLLKLFTSPPDVIAYKTHMQNVNLSIGGSGIVYAAQNLNISFPLAEQVTNVYVKPGDQVTKNQPLVQLDLSLLNAQIAQAAANVTATQNYLYSVLGTLQASAAQLAYDQAVSRYNALQAQASSPTLHNGTLVSSFDGTVTDVTVQSGELARANASLVTLQSDTTLIAHVQVPLANLPQVFVNQDALITPSALPNLTLHGTLSSIIQQSSAATDTFEVRVTLDNSNKQLLPGMSVFARLQQPLHTLAIPRMAVINSDRGAIVFVIGRDGHVIQRLVQTGGYVGDLVVIEAGLSDGDKVALTGVDTLRDGQTVNVSKVES